MVGSIRSLNSEWDMYRSRGAQLSYKEKGEGVRHPDLVRTDEEERTALNQDFSWI